MTIRAKSALLRLFFVLLLPAMLAKAQVTTASISGTVEDSSGRVVPGAMVTAHQLETGARRMLVTDATGHYWAADLSLGMYEVQAEFSGFQTGVRGGIELTVGRDAVVDFILKVGAIQEKVAVTGEAPLVNTSGSSMGEVVERQTMADLPLNGRDYTQLTLLVPGVVNVTTFAASSFFGLTRQISVAGARASSGGTYLLDGSNIMGFFNDSTGNPALGTALGVDAIQEFKVETNNFSPEYGRAGASVINTISRSGTNQFHGSVFEYLRNSALDARNYFDQPIAPGAPDKPSFKRNQFGASVGGPIRQDKLFFFVNYEGLRQSLGETELGGSPTGAARSGAVNPAIVPLLNLFPIPMGPDLGGGVGLLVTSATQAIHEDFAMGRVDYILSAKDSIFARFTFDDGGLRDPYPLPGAYIPDYYQLSQGQNRFLTLQETRIFSPNVVNSLRISFNRSKSTGNSPYDPPALNLIPGVTGRSAGAVSVGGVGYIGANPIVPYYLIINEWTWGDDLTIVRGKHVLKAGFEWQKIQDPYRADLYSGGLLSFNTLTDFLAGNPFTFIAPLPGKLNTERTWNESDGGMYVWDTYRATRSLTLNGGLRYEFITNPTESHGYFSSLTDFIAPAVTQFPHVFEKNPSLRNFAPRLGFAWDVLGDRKTSLRGGFGMFYQEYMPRDYAQYGFNPPQTVLGIGIFPGYPISPAALFALPPTIQLVTGYNITKTPYMLEYNLSVQRELLPGFVAEVGGLFSEGHHLLGAYDYNQPLPNGTLPDGTPIRTAAAMRPNPNFSALDFSLPIVNSNYSALILRLEKKFTHGSRFIAAYTWSHSLDEQSNEFNGDGWNDSGLITDINNLKLDYGNSTFDVRQNLVINYTYDLPWGQGLQGFTRKLVTGWELSGIATVHSGVPFSVENGFDRARTMGTFAPPETSDRPDLASGFSNNPVLGTTAHWFNPAAFQLQPAGAFGNLGRNTVIGPGLADLDMGFLKTIQATERLRAQFRFEAFNIVNHPNFAVPDFQNRQVILDASGTVNPQAGAITQTVTSSRQLQFALRLEF